MKIIAYFLPQFHEIEENNRWWGKGFTEWTNIKNARSLYEEHEQPIIPLNNNYYNLLKKETMEWQAQLANKYGIYGFCYYHYWFNGRKILEKPIENLLKWSDIPQKFCFCWANHSWKKTWNGTYEILIEQEYGQEEEWKKHINYLLKFFKDERYIKIENKPLLNIFLPKDVPNLDKRIEYYNKECIKHGFDGIYIIETIMKKDQKVTSRQSKAVVLREPNIGISESNWYEKLNYYIRGKFKKNFFKKPMIFNYNKITKNSLKFFKNFTIENKNIIPGSFNKWDSTPRHKNRGYIIENKNINEFKQYLLTQKKVMKERNIEYIFFNAWNEWAEGMYLEPDEKYKYKYLETIKEVIDTEV